MFQKNFNLVQAQVIAWKSELSISALSFIFGVVTSVIFAILFQINSKEILETLTRSFEDIRETALQENFLNIFLAIYQRNLTATAIIITSGLIFRYIPLTIVFLNGWILGIVFYSFTNLGAKIEQLISLLLPHGSFEIPAIILAAALGMRLSRLGKGRGLKGRVVALINSWRAVALVAILLFIAGLIESSLIIFLRPHP
ncbi:stage II sporulation protein M [Candidatus Microgenomates bacterium]|nr:stage II sporulation protein M [Candidatus Microgenomates bacterium]